MKKWLLLFPLILLLILFFVYRNGIIKDGPGGETTQEGQEGLWDPDDYVEGRVIHYQGSDWG